MHENHSPSAKFAVLKPKQVTYVNRVDSMRKVFFGGGGERASAHTRGVIGRRHRLFSFQSSFCYRGKICPMWESRRVSVVSYAAIKVIVSTSTGSVVLRFRLRICSIFDARREPHASSWTVRIVLTGSQTEFAERIWSFFKIIIV